jgi:hypothetical protein
VVGVTVAEEQQFALVDAQGVVMSVIVADQEFVDSLAEQVDDPDVDSGDLSFARTYDVTGKGVAVGFRRAANGKWVAPTPPEPSPEELAGLQAAEEAAAQRATDDEFVAAASAKLRSGGALTQAERDRLTLIQLERSG